ncbi:hypothetical protein RUND412_001030 [Rhizina undulata]
MPPKRMTANPVRPARYRPGKPIAPEESDSDSEESESSEEEQQQKPAPKAKKSVFEAPAVVSAALKKVDLNKRFEQSRKAEEERAAAVATSEGGEKNESEGSSSEYTTDSEDEESGSEEEEEEEVEAPKRVLLRPTFIPKNKRNAAAVSTITDPDTDAKKKAEEEARKKAEAQALLEEHLRRDVAAKAAGRKGWDDDEDNGEGVDDTDDLDPGAERANWKLRELLRVKREREELEKIEKEREEIERRRNMNPEQRRKEDIEFVKKQREEKKESRGQMGFMQKFYHKGAFYQGDSEVQNRNYATAAVEDSVKNREILPKYLQVRGDEVGKRGRTKWTHLTAEDTSMQAESPWFDKSSANKRATGRMGGMHGDERFMPDKDTERKREGNPGRDRNSDRRERRNDTDGDRFGQRDRSDRGGYRDRDRDRDFRGRGPPEGPRGDKRGNVDSGYRDRYVPDGSRSNRDREDRDGRDRGGYDRDRKREHSPGRRDKEFSVGDKRRRTDYSAGGN